MKNNTIRVIIVDDEPEIVDTLQSLLESFPGVSLIATAADAAQAHKHITQMQPDIAFLDIRMPGKSGLELAAELRAEKSRTKIVFVTAYDEYALQAIKLAAYDFLLKPVDPDELGKVFERFTSELTENKFDHKLDSILRQLSHNRKIRLNTKDGFIIVETDDIIFAEAEGNYTRIVFSKTKEEFVTMTLGSFQKLLSSEKFFRASRSCLINLSYVNRLERKCHKCELNKNGEVFTVSISREQMSLFNEIFR